MVFAVRYAAAILAVALMLAGLNAAVRALTRRRIALSSAQRILTVMESTMLTQHASVHVLKAEDRMYVVAATPTAIALLAEVPRSS